MAFERYVRHEAGTLTALHWERLISCLIHVLQCDKHSPLLMCCCLPLTSYCCIRKYVRSVTYALQLAEAVNTLYTLLTAKLE